MSSLTSDRPVPPAFVLADGADGVGYPQRLTLALRNPLSAAVGVTGDRVSGADARRFRVTSDTCAHRTLQSGTGCRLSVLFTPTRAGIGRAVLTLRGAGEPLLVQLRATASALPRVTRLTMIGATRRARRGDRAPTGSSHWCCCAPPAPAAHRVRTYVVTVTAINRHGVGAPRSVTVIVPAAR